MKKFLILTLTAFAVMSCQKESATDVETTQPTAPVIEAPVVDGTVSSEGQTVQLQISGDDAMKYDKNELRVPAGSTVQLTLTHIGTMSKQTMGHNWVLLKQGVDFQTFGMSAIAEKDNDYIPPQTTDVIVHTKMLGGGESDTITFTAPEPGTYTFICSFPGHFGSMNGKFIVE